MLSRLVRTISRLAIMKVVVVGALTLSVEAPLLSQTPSRPVFEVASVKGNETEPLTGPVRRISPGNLSYTSVTLAEFIQWAYDFPYSRIAAPRWMYGERYTIVAKAGTAATPPELKIMLQSLLEDRFKMKLHREVRDLPIFNLVVAKNGPKLKPTADPDTRSNIEFKAGKMEYTNGKLGDIVRLLEGAQSVGRPVIDRTGLTGHYEFAINMYDLQVSSGNLKDDVATSLSGSVSQVMSDLGLKLESDKGPVEFLVIDDAARVPTEN
jgi:uncharacterized protein (TIGR03435 family)